MLRFVHRQLPPLNFITIHWLYFLCTCILSAVIFWGASTPAKSVSFTDALFLVVSAMTLAGLNTVNLSTLNTFQQVMLFLLIFMGSAIFVSAFVVQVRKAAFEKRFQDIVNDKKKQPSDVRVGNDSQTHGVAHELQQEHAQPSTASGLLAATGDSANDHKKYRDERSARPLSSAEDDVRSTAAMSLAVSFSPELNLDKVKSRRSNYRDNESVFSMQGVGARPTASLDVIQTARSDEPDALRESRHSLSSEKDDRDSQHRFGFSTAWIGRNSQFHGLTEVEREQLGGYEYRAVQFLAWLVPAYLVLFQLLGCLGCASWIAYNQPDTARRNGLDPWWVGAVRQSSYWLTIKRIH
jgi:hypothetical protein